jgi:hypothetical protein
VHDRSGDRRTGVGDTAAGQAGRAAVDKRGRGGLKGRVGQKVALCEWRPGDKRRAHGQGDGPAAIGRRAGRCCRDATSMGFPAVARAGAVSGDRRGLGEKEPDRWAVRERGLTDGGPATGAGKRVGSG